MKTVIKVESHRRSGTHLLMTYLEREFGVKCEKTHKKGRGDIYLMRDSLDVLTSCYHWWKGSGEAEVNGIAKDFVDVGPKEFIRGIEVPNFVGVSGSITKADIQEGLFSDPIRYLKVHQTQGRERFFVRFEDLVENPRGVMRLIGKEFGFSLPEEVKKITNVVGYYPRKGIVGDYINLFDLEDIKLVRSVFNGK